MQNYPTMSREHSGKKLLVTTTNHISSFRFQNHVVFKFRDFLFSVVMRLLLKRTRRMIGKPNCCLTSIKLSAFLTMFMLNFVTFTFPALLDNHGEWNLNVSTV